MPSKTSKRSASDARGCPECVFEAEGIKLTVVGRRDPDGEGAGSPDKKATLAERIARAWTREERAAAEGSSSAHPLEYDERGFPIAQGPSGRAKRNP
jgi:hypothetical protein